MPPKSHAFQVDLGGMITLLSEHLYSSPRVYLRELLQNAVDAITSRRAVEPDHPGLVRLVIGERPSGERTLDVIDDGSGLTVDEVHTFLATLGRSSKSVDQLGRFGIGLLAGFLVSDSIVVTTRSVTGGPALRWTAKNDGSYTLAELDQDLPIGTTVRLVSKAGHGHRFEHVTLLREARDLAGLLAISIVVADPVLGADSVQTEPAPWTQTFRSKAHAERVWRAFGRPHLDEDPLIVFPIDGDGFRGVACVSPRSVVHGARLKHRISLRGMLINDQVDDLLPLWTPFIRCVLDVHDLTPLASREGFQDDRNLRRLRRDIDEALRNAFLNLPTTQPDAFKRLLAVHYRALEDLVLADDYCLEVIGPHWPLRGMHSLRSLQDIARDPRVRGHVRDHDQFRTLQPLVEAQGHDVICSAYGRDRLIIERVAELRPDLHLPELDSEDLLADTAGELSAGERRFVSLAQDMLRRHRVDVELRPMRPTTLPVLLDLLPEARRAQERSREREGSPQFAGLFDDLRQAERHTSHGRVVFNLANPLVRAVAHEPDVSRQRLMIETLWIEARMLARLPLTSEELDRLTQCLHRLLRMSVTPLFVEASYEREA